MREEKKVVLNEQLISLFDEVSETVYEKLGEYDAPVIRDALMYKFPKLVPYVDAYMAETFEDVGKGAFLTVQAFQEWVKSVSQIGAMSGKLLRTIKKKGDERLSGKGLAQRYRYFARERLHNNYGLSLIAGSQSKNRSRARV